MAKLKREEAEKQEHAAMRLAMQKHEIAMRKKELEIQIEQMALQDLEEDHRQRVAAAKLDEAELMDNRCLVTTQMNYICLKIGDQIEVRDLSGSGKFVSTR